MEQIHLNPYFESKPWGGDILNKIFKIDQSNIGEAWLISTIKNKESTLDNGETLTGFIKNNLYRLGLKNIEDFPVLIKLIDAKEDLSIQVHPDKEYALTKGFPNGKYECRYILKETKNNKIIYKHKHVKKNILIDAIKNNSLEKLLKYKKIKPKTLLKVTPGTVHAILKNTFLLEVQEPLDVTYRLYDYNRLPKRELHIEDAINVIYKRNRKIDKNKFKIKRNKDEFIIKIREFCRFFIKIDKNYNTYLVIKD